MGTRATSRASATQQASTEWLLHLIEDVLLQAPDSAIHRSLKYEGADTLVDFLNFTDGEIDNYKQEDGVKLAKKDKKKLKNLLTYVKYLHKKNNQYDWFSLEADDLQDFMMNIAPNMSGPHGDFRGIAGDKF